MCDHDLVKFILPAAFVRRRAVLSLNEVAIGLQEGWLLPIDAGGLAADACRRESVFVDESEGFIPVLRRRRMSREWKTTGDICDEHIIHVWRYLALAWTMEHAQDFSDILCVASAIHADFGHPRDMDGFVFNMPIADGEEAGEAAMIRRWNKYLVDGHEMYYRRRGGAYEAVE